MRNPILVLSLALLAACSQDAQPDPQTGPSAKPGVAASAEPAATASSEAPPLAGPVSAYTSFKDCKLVESGEGEDWSISRCKGIGGYDLQVDYGDARDDLVLLRRGKPPVKLNLFALGSGGFNTLGDAAEWRARGGADGSDPAMLIVRNKISEDPEDSAKQTHLLVVIDLKKACVIAQVRPQSGQNAAARSIADGAPRKCLSR
ncbi:MAG: hypothetical protein ABL914_01530 [Novosphingobium sp.]|uniref:hypothetical protein n=1 Tax=Novosphingobium sp. TaxID=1874826 RepID=UPI0032BEA5AD